MLLLSSKAGRLVVGELMFTELSRSVYNNYLVCDHTQGPSFKGQACVFQSVQVPAVEIPSPDPDTEHKVHEVPEGLQQRWKPFGWSKCVWQSRTPEVPKLVVCPLQMGCFFYC